MAHKAILTNNSVKEEMGFLYVNCRENEQKERKEKKEKKKKKEYLVYTLYAI